MGIKTTGLNPHVRRVVIELADRLQAAADRLDEITGTESPVDHGALLGLGDDDHPQYVTPARGASLFDALGSAADAEANANTHADGVAAAAEAAAIAHADTEDAAHSAADRAYTDAEVGSVSATVDGHIDETSGAHAASAVSHDPSHSPLIDAWLTATNVQSAIGQVASQLYAPTEEELDAMINALNALTTGTEIDNDDLFASNLIVSRHLAAGSVIAEKIDVADLNALGATIGGFTIDTDSIHSGAGNFDNSDTPLYLEDTGRLSLGSQFSWDGSDLSVRGALTGTAFELLGNAGNQLAYLSESSSPYPYSGLEPVGQISMNPGGTEFVDGHLEWIHDDNSNDSRGVRISTPYKYEVGYDKEPSQLVTEVFDNGTTWISSATLMSGTYDAYPTPSAQVGAVSDSGTDAWAYLTTTNGGSVYAYDGGGVTINGGGSDVFVAGELNLSATKTINFGNADRLIYDEGANVYRFGGDGLTTVKTSQFSVDNHSLVSSGIYRLKIIPEHYLPDNDYSVEIGELYSNPGVYTTAGQLQVGGSTGVALRQGNVQKLVIRSSHSYYGSAYINMAHTTTAGYLDNGFVVRAQSDSSAALGSQANIGLMTEWAGDHHVNLMLNEPAGDYLYLRNRENSGWIQAAASAWNIGSSRTTKDRIRTGREEGGLLNYAIPGDRKLAFRQVRKLRPVLFDDKVQHRDKRWMGCEHHNSRAECREADCPSEQPTELLHHCDDEDCGGTNERPCDFISRHVNRVGLIAEELDEVFPRAVSKDKLGNPIGIDYAVVTTELINEIQHLLEDRDEARKREARNTLMVRRLAKRIDELEAR